MMNGKRRNGRGPLASITTAALVKFLFSFAMTACGILAAYYTTVAGIKLELAQKADARAVAEMDKRVAAIDVQLTERFMTKEDFYRLKDEMLERLTKIEAKISKNGSTSLTINGEK
jgi:uncharacterized protein YdaU (DUF1376 family)